jgi:hypothetical protein
MKGKPSLKPLGLSAKKWRDATQMHEEKLSHQPKPPKAKLLRKRGEPKWGA